MRRRPTLIAAALAASLGLALAGCSGAAPTAAGARATGSASPTPTTPSPSPTAETPTPIPTPTPKPAASHSPKPKPKPTTVAAATTGHGRYAFPLRCSGVSYGHSHHDYPATDMFAPVGCAIVSPVDGVVDEVSTVDRWNPSTNLGAYRGGLSFSIVGVDGVRYYGSHLSVLNTNIRPGVHVSAGQSIGKVGRSGDARGGPSHMHFGISWPTGPGIWWVRRGELYPWPYLDAWRAGTMRSPGAAVRALHRAVGDHGCTVDC
jgi:murein DD-endopeptidase MepM/ murein hydrolase activator NlpD